MYLWTLLFSNENHPFLYCIDYLVDNFSENVDEIKSKLKRVVFELTIISLIRVICYRIMIMGSKDIGTMTDFKFKYNYY